MKRASIYQSDAIGHAAWLAARSIGCYPQVFLDGQLQPKCLAADEEEGWVEVYVLDAQGRYQLRWDDERRERVVCTERRYGRVHIEVRKG